MYAMLRHIQAVEMDHSRAAQAGVFVTSFPVGAWHDATEDLLSGDETRSALAQQVQDPLRAELIGELRDVIPRGGTRQEYSSRVAEGCGPGVPQPSTRVPGQERPGPQVHLFTVRGVRWQVT